MVHSTKEGIQLQSSTTSKDLEDHERQLRWKMAEFLLWRSLELREAFMNFNREDYSKVPTLKNREARLAQDKKAQWEDFQS